MPKTSTERARACRLRKRGEAPPLVRRPPKSVVQRVQEYRARQRALKAVAVTYNNPTSHILQDTSHNHWHSFNWQQKSNVDGSEPPSNAASPESQNIICTEIKTEPIDVEDDLIIAQRTDDVVPEGNPYADDATEDPLKFDSSSETRPPADAPSTINDSNLKTYKNVPTHSQKTEEILSVLTADDKNYIDEDKAFLLSLLPAMKELNGKQKMEFKMAILDSLRKIRYPYSDTTSKKVGNVTVLPIKNIQDLNNFDSLIPIQQPPPNIKQSFQNAVTLNTAGFQTTGKTNRSSQKREAFKESSGKTVQRRQPNTSASSEPTPKRQKQSDVTTKKLLTVVQPPLQILANENPTSLRLTEVIPIPPPETITAQALTLMGIDRVENTTSTVTSLQVGAPLEIQQTSSNTTGRRRTYKSVMKNTEPQSEEIGNDDPLSSTDLPRTSSSNSSNINVSEAGYSQSEMDEPLESEIEVNEIKLEFVKVEPFMDYEDPNTEI